MPKILIFGSCVSRDTRPFLGEDWSMLEYIARQSFISAASGRTRLQGSSKLTSAFQNTCLHNDFNGSFFTALAQRASETDLVVLDLVDERLGVQQLAGGGYVTNSWEFAMSGIAEENSQSLTLVDFATDEHFQLWCDAAEHVLKAISAAKLPVVVLAPAWALRSDNGKEMSYRGVAASTWNERYARYVDHLVALGVKVIRMPAEDVRASSSHQWGLEPFHYEDRVYETMQWEIKQYLADVSQPSRGAGRLLTWWRRRRRGH